MSARRSYKTTFVPSQIPAIAAGYWWDRRVYSGLGGTGFRIPERNGNTTFDRVQATVSAQPVAATGYLRYPATTGHDATSAAVAEGWTTKTTVWQWSRFPNGFPLTANRTALLFTHYGAGGARRFFMSAVTDAGATVRSIRGIYSTDGSAVFQYFWQPTIDSEWYFRLWLIDPSNATTSLRMRYFQGDGATITEQVATTAPAGGASLFNASAVVETAGNAALSSINGDDMDVATEGVFPGELTAAEMQAVMRYANPKLATPSPRLLVCDGDSITAGSTPAASYPGQLRNLLLAANWDTRNEGHTGDTMALMLSEYASTIRPYATAAPNNRRVLLVMEAYNAINGGASPAQVAADTAAYIALAVADGFKVVVGTALLSGDANATNIAAYNVLVRANFLSWGASALIDWAVTTGLTPAGVTANPTNYTDEVHPNTAGYALMAAAAKLVLQGIP